MSCQTPSIRQYAQRSRRWLPRSRRTVSLSQAPSALQRADDALARDSLDDVAGRWWPGDDLPESAHRVIALWAAGRTIKSIARELNMPRSRVKKYWERARVTLLARARDLSIHPPHRAAFALVSLGEPMSVVARALGVEPEDAPSELCRALLDTLREADPEEVQIRRCWLLETRRGKGRSVRQGSAK
ncbi:MAG: hypothetical protein GF320_20965 [Armatimonadia bacterium]|nr:hypothetical protein [Armatimonadia bacterium]